ncbi:MAG TPA: pyruvate kinase [Thermomicrobiales bacterium]|nr:pyruvate kinase [Thermomicrobiales bacterium]
MTQRARTKVVATIGPATESPKQIAAMIEAGVSVFRLNFSHGTRETHRRVYHTIREAAEQAERVTGILQDLQGPKLRIGELKDGSPFTLEQGETLRICTRPIEGTPDMVSTSYDRFGEDLRVGDPVLIDDGRLRFGVDSIERNTDEYGDIVTLTVLQAGTLSPRKGINLPETNVSAEALTEKDRADLEFGVELGVDMIALSFVRSADDIRTAKAAITEAGGTQPLIAKIEKPQAVRVLQQIVEAADGVMVARGDLGVEMPSEGVPLIQKQIIRAANVAGKPVITATQMLESMQQNPHPTRAEASDVANAILDGTDAIMLSGETAVGKYPIRAVETMIRIASSVERERLGTPWQLRREGIRSYHNQTESKAVGHAARALADDLRAKAIVVLTRTGETAQNVSEERPVEPIIAFTDNPVVGRRLALAYGVVPLVMPLRQTIDELIVQVNREIERRDYASTGDRVVIVGAAPRRNEHPSVFIEIHTMS